MRTSDARQPGRVGANTDLRSAWFPVFPPKKSSTRVSGQYYPEPSAKALKLSFGNLPSRAQARPSEETKTRTEDVQAIEGWCFTLNNYSAEEQEALRNAPCAYMTFGRERGDEGTPHLQGYVQFKTEKSLKQLKALMPRARRTSHGSNR